MGRYFFDRRNDWFTISWVSGESVCPVKGSCWDLCLKPCSVCQGPWLRSSGQRARLLLSWSEFKHTEVCILCKIGLPTYLPTYLPTNWPMIFQHSVVYFSYTSVRFNSIITVQHVSATSLLLKPFHCIRWEISLISLTLKCSQLN